MRTDPERAILRTCKGGVVAIRNLTKGDHQIGSTPNRKDFRDTLAQGPLNAGWVRAMYQHLERSEGRLLAKNWPTPFLRSCEVDNLLQQVMSSLISKLWIDVDEVGAAICGHCHVFAIGRFLQTSLHEQLGKRDSHRDRGESVIGEDHQIRHPLNSKTSNGRMNVTEIDIAIAQRIERRHRAEARDVLGQIRIVLP